MITKSEIRYFTGKPSHVLPGCKFELWPDDDTLALDILENSIQIYPRPGQPDTGLVVMKVVISPLVEREIAKQTELDNPLSDENVVEAISIMNIAAKVFQTPEGVRLAHPETVGTFTVIDTEEDGTETIKEVSKLDTESNFMGVG